MVANLERAIAIATDAHAGQTRFDGTPYIEHPLRVMRTVAIQGHSDRVQKVAVLHDTVEDSDWTFDDLRREGFGNEIIFPLELLTKQKPNHHLSEAEKLNVYDLYIQRLAVNACSRVVKKADIFDNLDLTGLENPSLKKIQNIEKYGRALLYLSRFSQPRL